MNELRQTQDSHYVTPWFKNEDRVEYDHLDDYVDIKEKHAINQTDWWKRMSGNMDIKVVMDLIHEYPNDQQLGSAIRKYYLDVKKNA